MDMEACIHTAAEVIRSRSSLQPQVGLIACVSASHC